MEILARLAPKHQSFEVGSTGFGALTWEDVAGAMRGLSPIAEAILRAKYVGDALALHELIWMISIDLKTEVKEFDRRMGMAQCLTEEIVSPQRCPKCKGVGYVGNSECKSCNGTGYRRKSGRDIERVANIPHQSWVRKYRSIYVRKIDFYSSVELWGISTVKRSS